MADEKGVDFKVLCVALADPLYGHVDALSQVSPHKLLEIEQFFQTYKNLEDKSVELDGWGGVAETLEILRTDRLRWLDEQRARQAAAERTEGPEAGPA
jgi:inorganic pyrophosphatase